MLMFFCLPPRWPQYTLSWFIKSLLSLYLSAFWRSYLCCSACETSGWFIATKTESRAALATLPEYCISYTPCFYLCPCCGLILDSLYIVQRRECTFCLSEKLQRSSGVKMCFSTCLPCRAVVSATHWLWKLRQGIMCKWEHDSVMGKKQINPRCLKRLNHKQDGENI